MTVLMRARRGHFVITSPDIEPVQFTRGKPVTGVQRIIRFADPRNRSRRGKTSNQDQGTESAILCAFRAYAALTISASFFRA
jgi:hypothetical protein